RLGNVKVPKSSANAFGNCEKNARQQDRELAIITVRKKSDAFISIHSSPWKWCDPPQNDLDFAKSTTSAGYCKVNYTSAARSHCGFCPWALESLHLCRGRPCPSNLAILSGRSCMGWSIENCNYRRYRIYRTPFGAGAGCKWTPGTLDFARHRRS